MPFISNYNSAIKILSGIGTGKCKGSCKTIWTQNIKYALKTKTNPLKLTKKERKNLTEKLKMVSKKDSINQHSKTLKKYIKRKSPPYPANENCGKKMKGNDGNIYESKPNKNSVCSWKKI